MMKPGRELDALIAERVMGWRICRCTPRDIDDWTKTSPHRYTLWKDFLGGDRRHCPRCESPTLKPYSTDIAASWEIIPRICKTPAIEFQVSIDGVWGSEGERWFAEFSNHIGHDLDYDYPGLGGERGMTAPHAICLAALKAIGVEA